MKKTTEWLYSQNKFNGQKNVLRHNQEEESRVISVTSGKGGVGKTSVALKLAKLFSLEHDTLLIDCDINLSNTAIKLGLPVTDNFFSLVKGIKSFDECLYKDKNFHLLSACNGNTDLFDKEMEFDDFIIDIISRHKHKYKYILLDCSADILKTTLNLNAYSDDRFIVVVPDKSSITDSYSLIKILAKKYDIFENYLIVNKISNTAQYQRIVKILGDTVDSFVGSQLRILGSIFFEKAKGINVFDSFLFNEEKSSLHHSFVKIIEKYTEGPFRERGLPSRAPSSRKRRLAHRATGPTIN